MALDRDETAERVMEIAETLIAEGGSVNLKARTIAEQAGIAVGSIYNLFGDLDQLHGKVNMRLLDQLGDAGMRAVVQMQKENVTDTRLRLLELSRTYLEFVQANPVGWASLLAFNPRRIAKDAQEAYEARLDTLLEIIGSVLALDETLALTSSQRRLSARVLWSSVHGIVINGSRRRQQIRDTEDVWLQIDCLVTTFLKGIDRKPSASQMN